jgi:hypothetical protein
MSSSSSHNTAQACPPIQDPGSVSFIIAAFSIFVASRAFADERRLNLSRHTGNDPALTGLLRVYKDYYPEIIVGEAVRGKASAFKHPDLQWRVRLDTIQEAHHQKAQRANGNAQDAFRVDRQGAFGRRGARASAIPFVQTSHATEVSRHLSGAITMLNIQGFRDIRRDRQC